MKIDTRGPPATKLRKAAREAVMRNFWLEANVEGRKTKVTAGPRGKDQQMSVTLHMRHKGQSMEVLNISCLPQSDGETLLVRVQLGDDVKEPMARKATELLDEEGAMGFAVYHPYNDPVLILKTER